MPKPKDASAEKPAGDVVLAKVRSFLALQGITYHYKTDGWLWERPGHYPEEVGWQHVLDTFTLYGPPSLQKMPKKTLAALHLHTEGARRAALSEVVQEIESWEPDPTQLDRWVDAVCDDGHEYTRVVMLHWMWLIRRKMLRLPVRDHLCPIFYGATGSGKSVEARKLLACVDTVVSEQNLSQVCDERHFGELARHYVVYCDEMAGADRASLDSLKKLITEEYTTSHVFFSQRRERARQNATLLGSSNKPVLDVIRDDTSARRFWEIRCRPRLDWAALESIDRRALWALADPTEDSPLAGDIQARVQELQHSKLRLRPPQELWAEECEIVPGDTPVAIGTLWEHFRAWAHQGGYYPGTRDKLGRWLREARFPRTRTGKKCTRCSLLSRSSADHILATLPRK